MAVCFSSKKKLLQAYLYSKLLQQSAIFWALQKLTNTFNKTAPYDFDQEHFHILQYQKKIQVRTSIIFR